MRTRTFRRGRQPTIGPWGILALIVGGILCAFTVGNLIVGNRSLAVWLPAIAGAPLLLYGIFKDACDRWFETRSGRILRWIIMALYLVLIAVMIFSSVLMISAASSEPAAGADAIVVLGAGVHGDAVTDSLRKRLDKALEYYNQNPGAVIVVTGGMGSGENVSEAEAMQKYLAERSVPSDHILV
ncbi:MAG: YdcF family protein, partial [Clostridia bacterium]|nr:YdcF family protein [Clostridia bacterium]